MTAREAYDIYMKEKPKKVVLGITETDSEFVFVTEDSGDGFNCVDKGTGQIRTVWFFELAEKVDAGNVKDLAFLDCIT